MPSAAELCDFTARELVTLIRSRGVSAKEILVAHLDRIESANPDLNAIVTLVPEAALAAADAAD